MKLPPPALLLDRNAVAKVLDLDECIAAVEAAFAAHDAGLSLEPALSHVDAPDGEFHIKSGGLREPRPYFACKVNGSFFNNRVNLGLPNIVGLIVLSDATNGTVQAVMESGLITRVRTGAATAVAARYLARHDSSVVTICGAGLQGQIQLEALSRVLPLNKVYFWSRNIERAKQTAAEAAEKLEIAVAATDVLSEATSVSDVIVTCTPSRQWFLGREHVRPGTFIAAVGADSPGKQELEPELLASAKLVCDLVEQCSHVGELQHIASRGNELRSRSMGSLGQVIRGTVTRRTGADDIIVFDSTGTALQDTAAAALVFERARQAGIGSPFAFWGTG